MTEPPTVTEPTNIDPAALLADLGAADQEIRRLHWSLRQIIALSDDAPQLADRELRARLVALTSDAR